MMIDETINEPAKMTFLTAFKSLTGYDEVAVESHFRKGLGDMSGTASSRAVLFVLARRNGMTDSEAFQHAMNMPLGDVDASFLPEPKDGVDVVEGKAPNSNS